MTFKLKKYILSFFLSLHCVLSFSIAPTSSSSRQLKHISVNNYFETSLIFPTRLPKCRNSFTSTFLPYKVTIPHDDTSTVTTKSSYGERSRKYRRDLFSYDDWVKHRNNDIRFMSSVTDIFKSGIIRQTINSCILATSIATFVVIYNAILVNGWFDINGIFHKALSTRFPLFAIPSAFFTLTSPALSLLLVFKTDTSYQRWDEGRKSWGTIVNNSRTIMREGSAWLHQSNISSVDKHYKLKRLSLAVWSFSRSLTRHLLSYNEDEIDYINDCKKYLRNDYSNDLINARHRPTRAMYELACAINEFPLSDWHRITMDNAVTSLCDALGSTERIFSSPIPLFYTKHTSRFLEIWLMLLPFTLYPTFTYTWNSWLTIPATLLISFFLIGIDEKGRQLEEPFSILPMHKITDNIYLSVNDHVQWFLEDEKRNLNQQ